MAAKRKPAAKVRGAEAIRAESEAARIKVQADQRVRLVAHFKGLIAANPGNEALLADVRSKLGDDEYASVVG